MEDERGASTLRQAEAAGLAVPFVPWSAIEPDFLARWDQGQHLAVFGPNGTGKSHFAFTVAEDRVALRGASCVILANKPRDKSLSSLAAKGWRRIAEWPPGYEERLGRRVILWPRYPGPSNPRANRRVFMRALDGIMREGNWLVVLDEARYWVEQMGLRTQLDEMWTASRSNGITLVAGAQGPSWINTAMREELQWGAFFRPQHRERAMDVADITGDRRLWPVLMGLRRHEFILGQLRTDTYVRTRLPKPSAPAGSAEPKADSPSPPR